VGERAVLFAPAAVAATVEWETEGSVMAGGPSGWV